MTKWQSDKVSHRDYNLTRYKVTKCQMNNINRMTERQREQSCDQVMNCDQETVFHSAVTTMGRCNIVTRNNIS